MNVTDEVIGYGQIQSLVTVKKNSEIRERNPSTKMSPHPVIKSPQEIFQET